jgi:hypothetical protein
MSWTETKRVLHCGDNQQLTFEKKEHKIRLSVSNYHPTAYVYEIDGRDVSRATITFERTNSQQDFDNLDSLIEQNEKRKAHWSSRFWDWLARL